VRPLREAARRAGALGPMPAGGFKGTPFHQTSSQLWAAGGGGEVGARDEGGEGGETYAGWDPDKQANAGSGMGVWGAGGYDGYGGGWDSGGEGESRTQPLTQPPYIWGRSTGVCVCACLCWCGCVFVIVQCTILTLCVLPLLLLMCS
jgi:hypothetical protein